MVSGFRDALVSAAVLAAVVAFPALAQIPVKTASGPVSGVTADGVESFKGIPFAAPPVGDLRWRAPQPAAHWMTPLKADHYGHDCMQEPFGGDAAPLGTTPSEDCLVLNVWRPAGHHDKLPVIVWIYGGGFVNGGSSPAVYDGSAFARKDVIMVSFNYRLGRFGFFGHPALTAEDKDDLLGNYGYMDQIAALKWVQANIKAFGGDPANVTIFGESAGGGSVHMLMTSPLTRGLFAKAIVQSGGGRGNLMGERRLHEDMPGQPSSETLGVALARANGIDGTDAAALAKLRALPAEVVTNKLSLANMASDTYGGPMVDGKIVVETPQAAYLAGRYNKAPLIIGANSADIGFNFAQTKEATFAPFGANIAAAKAAYDPLGKFTVEVIRYFMGMDAMMIEPARFVASTLATQGVPSYEYRYAYVADSMQAEWKTGTPHATEIPYVMDTVAAKYGDKLTAKDAKIADQTNSYWANFAKTGNPNGQGLPEWPQYDPKADVLLNFASDGVPVAMPDPWKARLDVTAGLAQ